MALREDIDVSRNSSLRAFLQSPLSAQIRVVYQRTPVLPPAHPEYLWSGNGDEYWPW